MLRIFVILIGLAAYGAYNLVEEFLPGPSPGAVQPAKPATSPQAGTGWFNNLSGAAVSAAASWTGLNTRDLPEGAEGCSTSALSPESIQSLLDALPDVQRDALLQLGVMDAGNAAASLVALQPYKGDLGVGLCLLKFRKVVLLPDSAAQLLNRR